MKTWKLIVSFGATLALVSGIVAEFRGQTPAPATQAERAMTAAAAENKFTFVLFWKENNTATKDLAAKVKAAVATRSDRAVTVGVNSTDAAEKALIERYGVTRAPLPLVLVVAPNGAITGAYPQKFSEASVDESLVSPAMTRCVKSLQEGKLVLACLQTASAAPVPQGVREFAASPHVKGKTEIIAVNLQDPAEKRFMSDLRLNAQQMPAVIFLAPPGTFVGQFGASVTSQELARKLHAAGKCCNDPKCKHNH